jgi:hypothetical protein
MSVLLGVRSSVLLGLLATGAQACAVSFTAGETMNPTIVAGLNDVLGPIINLSYTDPALVAATQAIGVKGFRHPGGTVGNYWSIENGSYVGPDGTTESGCSNGSHWSYCNYDHRGDAADSTRFSTQNFVQGVGKGTSNVFMLNVFSLTPSAQLAQIDYLSRLGTAVDRLELGNEFNHPQYGWHFPNVQAYLASIKPVIAHARRVLPRAAIAVVAAKGGKWNSGLAAALTAHAHAQASQATRPGAGAGAGAAPPLFDALTVHQYSPQSSVVSSYPAEQQPSVVAGWADGEFRTLVALLRKDFPKGVEVGAWVWV